MHACMHIYACMDVLAHEIKHSLFLHTALPILWSCTVRKKISSGSTWYDSESFACNRSTLMDVYLSYTKFLTIFYKQ